MINISIYIPRFSHLPKYQFSSYNAAGVWLLGLNAAKSNLKTSESSPVQRFTVWQQEQLLLSLTITLNALVFWRKILACLLESKWSSSFESSSSVRLQENLTPRSFYSAQVYIPFQSRPSGFSPSLPIQIAVKDISYKPVKRKLLTGLGFIESAAYLCSIFWQ